jgi:hypothetical protein
MRNNLLSATAIGILSYVVACAPVQFDRVEDPSCGSNGVVCVKKCEGAECIKTVTLEKQVGEGLVDILFVNDNSGSMSFEQSKMADRFPSFLQSLGTLNYRVAMVTTDISGPLNNPKAANGNGAWQDGRLVPFANGAAFLSRDTANKEQLFSQAIKRSETLSCESSGFATASCPSSDERGIFAAYNVVRSGGTGSSGFLRNNAHLAVILLSDEDVRGTSDKTLRMDGKSVPSSYPWVQQQEDKAENFVSTMRSVHPDKSFSFHSIIVRPEQARYSLSAAEQAEARDCRYNKQTGQGGNAWVVGTPGYEYADLSLLTGGIIGSICTNDYQAILQNIGFTIQDQVTSLPFSCNPIARADGSRFDLYVNNQPAVGLNISADYTKLVLNINQALPPMTRLKLVYDCRID